MRVEREKSLDKDMQHHLRHKLKSHKWAMETITVVPLRKYFSLILDQSNI